MIASSSATEEVVRSSKAAQKKLKLYEQLLGLRIQLQKPFQLLNKLPPAGKEGGGFRSIDLGVVDVDLADDLRGIVGGLGSISGVRVDSFGQTNHHSDKDLDAIWNGLEEHQNQQFVSQWRPVLDKMHDKTLLGGGVKGQTLKVFHTSFWNKIDNVLSDENKVIEKSRPLAAETPRLGVSDSLRAFGGDEDLSLAAADADSLGLLRVEQYHSDDLAEEQLRKVGKKSKRSQWRDGEVFDDGAFYSLLLKSFLQSASANSQLGGEDLATLRQLKRRKNSVDRKASKGRKIRYVVHSKLENFMFPTPLGNETASLSFDSDRLFRSLFQ